jgi:hypothetical protein
MTADTPGEAASTVPKALNHADVNVGTVPPPNNAEYMDGDAFLYILEDHVCYCSLNIRDGGLVYALGALFEKAGLGENSALFSLEKIADASKLQMIAQRGVKEVVLDASLYEATSLFNARHAEPVGLLRSIGRTFYSLRANDNADRVDNLQVRVSITADGRVRHNEHLGDERIKDLARRLVNNEHDGDHYTIITKDDQKITADSILLHKIVRIAAFGKSVALEPTWTELIHYYAELEDGNFLEQ